MKKMTSLLLSLFLFQTSLAETFFDNQKELINSRTPASYIPPTLQDRLQKKERPEEKKSNNTPPPIPSLQEPNADEDYGLSGDWGGYRKNLSDWGIDVGIIYKSDLTRNTTGGVERKTMYLDNLDLRADFDLEKIANAKGLHLFVYAIKNSGADSGNRPSQVYGDLQWTSNIETFVDDFRLYQAYLEQLFYDDKVSVLLGLHDLNSEFYVTPTATLFLHSSFGIGLEFSQTGANGSSIFPYTAPAVRIKVEPTTNVYLQTAVFNAQAGHPTQKTGTHFRVNATDGRLMISEIGTTGSESLPRKFSLGYWSYDRTFDHLTDTVTDSEGNLSAKQVSSSGAYTSADFSFTKNVAVFFTYGLASSASNPIKDNLTFGASYTGLIPGRDTDRLGLAFSRVSPGKPFKSTAALEAFESAFELTYRAEIMRGMVLQPDLQYIVNPGLDSNLKDVFITTLRFEFEF